MAMLVFIHGANGQYKPTENGITASPRVKQMINDKPKKGNIPSTTQTNKVANCQCQCCQKVLVSPKNK